MQFYRYAKNEIWAQDKEKQKAELARQRHQARLDRLEREQKEREAKLRQKAPRQTASTAATPEADKLPIEAAVARAKPHRIAVPADTSPESVATDADHSEPNP